MSATSRAIATSSSGTPSKLSIGRSRHPAAISVGSNPTFAGSRRTVEAFLLDFDGDLYGEHVGVEFVHRLRPMLTFDGVPELLVAMARDVAETRTALGLPG